MVKYVQYEYVEVIPKYYNESPRNIDSVTNGETTYEKKIENTKGIKFFEFFLHVLLKIILISDWNKLDSYIK